MVSGHEHMSLLSKLINHHRKLGRQAWFGLKQNRYLLVFSNLCWNAVLIREYGRTLM